jgi:hypothetical protein
MPEALQLALDPEAALDQRLDQVLAGRQGKYPLPEEGKRLLGLLRWHKGAARAIPLREIRERLNGAPNEPVQLMDRDIKFLAKVLTEDFGVPVGACRSSGHGGRGEAGGIHGYFLCVTPEDLELAARPYIHELISLARRIRALRGPQMVEHAFAQARLSCSADGDTPRPAGADPKEAA